MPITTAEINQETWFKISDHDSQRPFFISLVSDSNHWMFISSNGGLTAGRKNSEFALFPYYTDDKLTELSHTTGSKTIIQVLIDGSMQTWEPFSEHKAGSFHISRNLYKNRLGNKIMFEEINHDCGLTFQYEWNTSNLYGFVRKSRLINNTDASISGSVLDGIQNIMPHGVNPATQQAASNLVDAYKRSELAEDAGMGIFALSAIIVDKAEPSEALKANVAWSMGLNSPSYLLSSLQLQAFRAGRPVQQETDIKGEKGAYFVAEDFELQAGVAKNWTIVANVNIDQSHAVRLIHDIKNDASLPKKVEDDIEQGSARLLELVASADGIQRSADPLNDTRHYSNVLFNIMRGGIFDRNYQFEKQDFLKYLKGASKAVFNRNQDFLASLPEVFEKAELHQRIESSDDPDLIRLCIEYLPLKFSRRHGDPSRPWNQFSINTVDETDGTKILDYEGNWRDIFQNWEALAHSYPDFIEGMLFKFLNASTFEGYNPYRITKGGIDWEIIEPDDPWSYIGYWGDHQIIYLLKFLEFYQEYDPEAFQSLMQKDWFVYANVPYRIKPYESILENPKDTIEFDTEADLKIRDLMAKEGADAALLTNRNGEIHHVNFVEKILATVLSKLSNFIPEGGIWMNTQRPEWNDANNALVGNGVSMVTLYYLRRFLKFFASVFDNPELKEVAVSKELAVFFASVQVALSQNSGVLSSGINDSVRKKIADSLGKAGSAYRTRVYSKHFEGGTSTISVGDLTSFIEVALKYLDHSIAVNRRPDGLYHAYNLVSIHEDGMSISHLDEMLEGQVAVLSSGYLNTKEAVKLMDALRKSALYREDQSSYILYPNKRLPGFLEKNRIPAESVEKSALMKQLLQDGDLSVLSQDVLGQCHFNGNFKNAGDLKIALERLKEGPYSKLVEKEKGLLLQTFEQVFNHKAFTGRSGTFFAYEGLGSIYWHMVSKLRLALAEVYGKAVQEGAGKRQLSPLARHFDEVSYGIGTHKKPELYGAFPTDPYSHTPQHRGAQQPGMTGQVKEDVITRFMELGVSIQQGRLCFDPLLLRKAEFVSSSELVECIDIHGNPTPVEIPDDALCFTICQVPVLYRLGQDNSVTVYTDQDEHSRDDLCLEEELSREIFLRSGKIQRLEVTLKADRLRS